MSLNNAMGDVQLRDTYYIEAHYNYVAMLVAMFGVFAGPYFLFPRITGRIYNSVLSKLHFGLTLAGANITLLPVLVLNWHGPPRRFADISDTSFAQANLVSSSGALLMALGVLVFLATMVEALVRRAPK